VQPTPVPVPSLTAILDGASQVVLWMKDNTTLIVGFALFSYITGRIITAVNGKTKTSAASATTVTKNTDGSTTIEIP
jgi:hypothetical protein